MAEYDQSYKNLFSHPQLVRDLLQGFIKEQWVAGLDLDTLEKVNGSYIADDLRKREDDIIWRVRWSKEWIYVYLLRSGSIGFYCRYACLARKSQR